MIDWYQLIDLVSTSYFQEICLLQIESFNFETWSGTQNRSKCSWSFKLIYKTAFQDVYASNGIIWLYFLLCSCEHKNWVKLFDHKNSSLSRTCQRYCYCLAMHLVFYHAFVWHKVERIERLEISPGQSEMNNVWWAPHLHLFCQRNQPIERRSWPRQLYLTITKISTYIYRL